MLLRLRNNVAAMTAMIREQDRTAHNMANADTVGFKRDRTFTEVLRHRMEADGSVQSERVTRQWVDLSQGTLDQTGNPLDVAIQGEGFFVVSDEEGTQRFTRAGRFQVDNEGMLRTPQGLAVEGAGGPIQIPSEATSVEIARDGTIKADGRRIGQFQIVNFEDPSQLTRLDGSTFEAGDAEPIEHTAEIHQGFVESSNVDPMKEMTGMIEQLRTFEMQQRMLRSADENLSSAVRRLGRY